MAGDVPSAAQTSRNRLEDRDAGRRIGRWPAARRHPSKEKRIALTRLIVLAWFAPGVILLAALLAAAVRGRTVNPDDWKPCAGHDPLDPAAKQCWVPKAGSADYCPRHDGSGATTLLT
jgi:hypothetical protein